MIRSLFLAAAIAMMAASSVQASIITTLYARNNGGSNGGAVYFDINTASNALTVTGFDTNTLDTVAFTDFQIWVLAGLTSQGNEAGPGWVKVATGSGTGAGADLPTSITLSNSFGLNANSLYGVALVADVAIGHDYTNGTGTNQFYSNADLSLTLGSASNVPFTPGFFVPRVWNGSIYYDVARPVVPEPASMVIFGMGAVWLVGLRRRSIR